MLGQSRLKSAAVVLGLSAPLLLAGCVTEETQLQNNGTDVYDPSGLMSLLNATIVAGNPDSGKAAFLGTFLNSAQETDQVESITANGVEADMTEIQLVDGLATAVQTGRETTAEFSDFNVTRSSYVPVTVRYKNAAEMNFQALVVPPGGYYFEAAPAGTKPEGILSELPDEVTGEETTATDKVATDNEEFGTQE